jgi:hypothetical protein
MASIDPDSASLLPGYYPACVGIDVAKRKAARPESGDAVAHGND